MAIALEPPDQMSADEPARTQHQNIRHLVIIP
jgi:hypothetical protein